HSTISNPTPVSRPMNSTGRVSSLNNRRKHGDRKSPDKPIIRPSQRNKHQTLPGQKQATEKIQADCSKTPTTREWLHRESYTACSIVFYQHYNSRAHMPHHRYKLPDLPYAYNALVPT